MSVTFELIHVGSNNRSRTASRGRINEQSLRAGLISEALTIPGYRVKAVLSQMEKKTAL